MRKRDKVYHFGITKIPFGFYVWRMTNEAIRKNNRERMEKDFVGAIVAKDRTSALARYLEHLHETGG